MQFMYVVVTLLETAQSIIASTPIIFYRLLQSGDVEQNPGPGKIIRNDSLELHAYLMVIVFSYNIQILIMMLLILKRC